MKPGLIFEMRWKMTLNAFCTPRNCAAYIRAKVFKELSNRKQSHTLSVINGQMVHVRDLF